MDYMPFIWPLLIIAIAIIGITFFVRRFHGAPAMEGFTALAMLGVLWIAGYSLSLSASSLPLKILFLDMQFIPVALMAPAVLAFSLQYAGREHWITRPRFALLLVVPLVSIVAALSSNYHTLFRYDFRLVETGPLTVMLYSRGPLFWLYYVNAIGMILAVLWILFNATRTRVLYADYAFLLHSSLLIPMLTDALYQLGISPVAGVNLSPVLFILPAGLYWWVARRESMFDVAPMARRTVMENLKDPVIALDREGRIAEFNRAAQATCGIAVKSIGATIDALAPEWGSVFQRYQGQSEVKAEVELGGCDPRRVYELTITPLCDGNGRVRGRLFLFHDMTEFVSREEQLRKLTEAVEQSPVSIIITGLDGAIEYVNPRFSETSGYAAEEVLGKNPRMFKSGLTPPETYRQLWKNIKQGREWRGEFINRKKNGELYFELAAITAISDKSGAIKHYVAVKEDITERKQKEAELEERFKFEFLLSTLSATFVNVSTDEVVHQIERAVESIVNYLRVERGTVFDFTEEEGTRIIYSYAAPGIPQTTGENSRTFPWYFEILSRGEVIQLESRRDLPAKAQVELELGQQLGIKSYLAIPLQVGGRILGGLGFATFTAEHTWPDELVARLRLLGNVFANALMRQQTEKALARAREAAEQSRRQAAQVESYRRFRELLEDIDLIAVILDRDGNITFANEHVLRLCGYECSEVMGRNWFELFVPQEQAQAELELYRTTVARSEEFSSFERRLVTRAGNTRLVAWNHTLLRGGDGVEIIGTAIIGRDITESKRQEAERDALTRRLQALGRMGQSVLSSLDLNTVLKLVVSEMAQLLPTRDISILLQDEQSLVFAAVEGESASQLQGYHMPIDSGVVGEVMRTGRAIHITAPAALEQMYPAVMNFTGYRAESLLAVPLKHRDRIFGAMEAVAKSQHAFSEEDFQLLESAANWAAIAISNAQHHADLARRLQETRAMAEINLSLSRSLDVSQILIQIAGAAQEIIPQAEQAVIHLMDEETRTLEPVAVAGAVSTAHPLQMRWGEGIAGRALAEGQAINIGDMRLAPAYFPSASPSPVRSLLVVPIEGAQTRGTITVSSSIPDVFKAYDLGLLVHLGSQASIALRNAQLYDEIRRRASQLEGLYSELGSTLRKEQAMRAQLVLADKLSALGRMVASVAHELNNPLQAIQNCLYIVGQDQRTSKTSQKYLQVASGEIQRLTGLVTQLNSVYQPSRDRPGQLVTLGDLLDGINALLAKHLTKNQVVLDCAPPPPELANTLVPSEFRQVFMNLYLNAVDAMQPDGGKLKVTVSPCERDKEVEISFEDTGHGVAEEDAPHIFEPFYTTKGSGMGLGLALCYDIVTAYGGRIALVQRSGPGAQFTITIPLG